jgi:anti-sigma B factor antagonist
MKASSFAIRRETVDGTSVVTASGDIDLSSAAEFEAQLAGAVEDTTRGIVVDLSGVTFMDSTALNALVHCFERQRARLERFSLVSTDSRVTSLLEVTRLDRILEVCPSRAEALTRVRQD